MSDCCYNLSSAEARAYPHTVPLVAMDHCQADTISKKHLKNVMNGVLENLAIELARICMHAKLNQDVICLWGAMMISAVTAQLRG